VRRLEPVKVVLAADVKLEGRPIGRGAKRLQDGLDTSFSEIDRCDRILFGVAF
jgi:hypothetical protein